MANDTNQKLARETPDLRAERLDRLRDIVPEAFAEGKLLPDKLADVLGEGVDTRPERYSFTWAGKRDAVKLLQTPTSATLIPVLSDSLSFETAQQVFIEGENLEVLKLLYRSYFGRVKTVIIDPPYNTGNDFIYSDDFAAPLDHYLKLTGQKAGNGKLLTSNPETSGRYHSAWLSMMYPRLFLARQLLRDDGTIFVHIDDHEVANLRLLMNEIFGEENFIACIIWQKVFSPKNTAKHFSEDHDYILVYARSGERWLPQLLPRSEQAEGRYVNVDDDPRGPWSSSDLTARNYYSEGIYEVTSPGGKKFSATIGAYWRVKKEKFDKLDRDNRIWWGEDRNSMPRLKRFLSEVKKGVVPQTLWKYQDVGHTQEAKKELLEAVKFTNTDNVIDTVKPTRLIQRILQIATEADTRDLVLDFFSGTNSTTHAVLKQNKADNGNRRVIAVQFPEKLPASEPDKATIADIGKERAKHALRTCFDEADKDGLRVFRLAGSNFKRWNAADNEGTGSYMKQLDAFEQEALVGDVSAILWEVALREGFSLTSAVSKMETKSISAWRVRDGDSPRQFILSLDDRISAEGIAELGLGTDDLFICRDAVLDDTQAANLALQCRLKTL